jgi:hypothetical protein
MPLTSKARLTFIEGLAWPPGAVRVQILDENGLVVHSRAKEEDR